LTYKFTPKVQFDVEQLLVEHWDSILGTIVARKNCGDVEFDDAVLGPLAALLRNVDSTRRCETADEFAAAVE